MLINKISNVTLYNDNSKYGTIGSQLVAVEPLDARARKNDNIENVDFTLKEHRCKNCGATLNVNNYKSIIKCEYCGSIFHKHNL